ncbi:hypothetical protein SLOPH_1115 [Spraguea lophii 42_110]|uniref:SAP domain-containing protein n=1 Tax=Spraguea lophii (strain 42_110) TaxID=1358809 RepID=S7XHK8_SPRLO|nr:hypothetical protein SLOPH_1115 [Spraguea lophii 42_110]
MKYEEQTVAVLREECKKYNINTTNKKKSELIKTLQERTSSNINIDDKTNIDDNTNIDDKIERRRQRFGVMEDKIKEREEKYKVNEKVEERRKRFGNMTEEEKKKVEKRKQKYSVD